MSNVEKLIAVRKARAELKREYGLFKAEMAELEPRLEALERERRGTSPSSTIPINDGITVRDGKVWRR